MRAIKKINNNVAICMDGNQQELVAFGNGIGFPSMPYEIQDLARIDRTFYCIDSRFLALLNEIPTEVFEVAAQITDQAQQSLQCDLNPNLLVTLADHINFAIIRMKKYRQMKMQFSYDIEQLYPLETELGRYAVELIRKRLGVVLPQSEITNIAIHFINAQWEQNNIMSPNNQEDLIEQITQQIERFFSIQIDRKTFDFNRFAMHMRYFLKRIHEDRQYTDNDQKLLDVMQQQEPEIYVCVQQISAYIDAAMHKTCTNDELLYLMIHIHRILKRQASNV